MKGNTVMLNCTLFLIHSSFSFKNTNSQETCRQRPRCETGAGQLQLSQVSAGSPGSSSSPPNYWFSSPLGTAGKSPVCVVDLPKHKIWRWFLKIFLCRYVSSLLDEQIPNKYFWVNTVNTIAIRAGRRGFPCCEQVHSEDCGSFPWARGSLAGHPCTSSLGFFVQACGVTKIVKIKQEPTKWNANSNLCLKSQYLVNTLLSLLFFLLLFPTLPSLPHFFPSFPFFPSFLRILIHGRLCPGTMLLLLDWSAHPQCKGHNLFRVSNHQGIANQSHDEASHLLGWLRVIIKSRNKCWQGCALVVGVYSHSGNWCVGPLKN